MACREMGVYFDAMTQDMGGKLSGYFLGLQGHFGDPRVQAAQQQKMEAREASAAHSQHTAGLLKEAYASRQAKNREEHNTRMSRRQESQSSAAHPVSPPAPARRRTAPSPPTQQAAETEARPSAS